MSNLKNLFKAEQFCIPGIHLPMHAAEMAQIILDEALDERFDFGSGE